MARGPLITPEIREQVLALVPEIGVKRTAMQLSIADGTVASICIEGGLNTHALAAKRATAASVDFARERRLDLVNKLAARVEECLDDPESGRDPRQLQHLAVSLGIAIDKRRLEDGLSTFNADAHITSFTVRQPTPSESASSS